jgi:transposase
MDKITLVGVDTAKTNLVVCGMAGEKRVFTKEIKREKVLSIFAQMPPTDIVMEACGGSHYWGRELTKLGHNAKLIAPQKVTPFRKLNKNDKNDAFATVRAAKCPEIEFVPVKEVWQQDLQSLHRVRERHIKNQTALVNEMRGLLMEYGFVIPKGINHVRSRVPALIQDRDNDLTSIIRSVIGDLHSELLTITDSIERIDKQLEEVFKANETCQRIEAIEGVGVITATAIIAACANPHLFRNGRQFSAWLGLTPGHTQSGGKNGKIIMLGITKKGDSYIRKLLVQGALSVAIRAQHLKPETPIPISTEASVPSTSKKVDKKKPEAPFRARKKLLSHQAKPKEQNRLLWFKRLIDEKGKQKAAVAFANRNARVIWALLKSGESYDLTRSHANAS